MTPVWALVRVLDAPAVRKKRQEEFDTAEAGDFLDSERKLGLDPIVILKERQQQMFAMARKLKSVETASVCKEICPTVRVTSVQ